MQETYIVIFSYFAIGLGVINLFAREIVPHKYRKLEAMKKAFGAVPGHLIHILAYSLVPIVVGVGLLFGQP